MDKAMAWTMFAAAALGNSAICTGTAKEYELKNWFGGRGGIHKEEIAAVQAARYADELSKLVRS